MPKSIPTTVEEAAFLNGALGESPTEATPVPVQPSEEVAVSVADDRYTQGRWTGIAQISCVRCPWDTLEGLDAFDAHWDERHAPPRPLPPPPPTPVLFGLNGEPLTSSATED